MSCAMPPQQELCPVGVGYAPSSQPPLELIANHHILYNNSTTNVSSAPFSSPSDSMLSESDLDSFQNGRTEDSPRSNSSTSSPLHHQKTTPISALGQVLRSNNYKSVITATHLPQSSPDYIQQQTKFQQRTYASCSPTTDPTYNDSCYFEATRQQQHLDTSIKYALSKCDTYADCLSSSNGANDYACSTDPDGVQPQYTSVIVDAQQYQMSNGFVH